MLRFPGFGAWRVWGFRNSQCSGSPVSWVCGSFVGVFSVFFWGYFLASGFVGVEFFWGLGVDLGFGMSPSPFERLLSGWSVGAVAFTF